MTVNTNILNNQTIASDFTVNGTSGSTRTCLVDNNNNTASSQVKLLCRVGGGTAGDVYDTWTVGSTQAYCLGIDNSDSDRLKLNTQAAAGTNPSSGTNLLVVQSSGEWNRALQPAFMARQSSTLDNLTGDGTVYTVIFDTEQYDQGADYNNATGTFTAPVTGRYLLTTSTRGRDFTASFTTAITSLVTSNRTYTGMKLNPGALDTSAAPTDCTTQCAAICDMDAADTCTVTYQVSGSTKTIALLGSTNTMTVFSGCLLA